MNLQKVKIVSYSDIQVNIDNQALQLVEEYLYLVHNIRMKKLNQRARIKSKSRSNVAAFGKLGLTKKSAQRIRISQIAMESAMSNSALDIE